METEEVEIAVPDRFRVNSPETANWVVRQVINARTYLAHVETWAAAETKRANNQEAFFLSRFGIELEEWTRHEIAQRYRRKSIPLPAGTVGFRSEVPKLLVVDEPALIAWCQGHLRSALRIHTTVLKSEVFAYLKRTGEQPPGAEVDLEGHERFYIK